MLRSHRVMLRYALFRAWTCSCFLTCLICFAMTSKRSSAGPFSTNREVGPPLVQAGVSLYRMAKRSIQFMHPTPTPPPPLPTVVKIHKQRSERERAREVESSLIMSIFPSTLPSPPPHLIAERGRGLPGVFYQPLDMVSLLSNFKMCTVNETCIYLLGCIDRLFCWFCLAWAFYFIVEPAHWASCLYTCVYMLGWRGNLCFFPSHSFWGLCWIAQSLHAITHRNDSVSTDDTQLVFELKRELARSRPLFTKHAVRAWSSLWIADCLSILAPQ